MCIIGGGLTTTTPRFNYILTTYRYQVEGGKNRKIHGQHMDIKNNLFFILHGQHMGITMGNPIFNTLFNNYRTFIIALKLLLNHS